GAPPCPVDRPPRPTPPGPPPPALGQPAGGVPDPSVQVPPHGTPDVAPLPAPPAARDRAHLRVDLPERSPGESRGGPPPPRDHACRAVHRLPPADHALSAGQRRAQRPRVPPRLPGRPGADMPPALPGRADRGGGPRC